jgi:hypothetical protein
VPSPCDACIWEDLIISKDTSCDHLLPQNAEFSSPGLGVRYDRTRRAGPMVSVRGRARRRIAMISVPVT